MGGHVRAVFTLITIIFIICVIITVTSFQEIPLKFLESTPIRLQDDDSDNENNVCKNTQQDSRPKTIKHNTSDTNLKVEKQEYGSYGTLDDMPDEIPKFVSSFYN